MYAVILTQNGKFIKLIAFVNSTQEVDEIAKQLTDKHGEQWLIENGYRLNVELAG